MDTFLIEHEQLVIWLVAGILSFFFILPYWIRKKRMETHTEEADERAERYGLKEPVSLYPRVDPDLCIGSAGCVEACPEQDVLGLRNGLGVAVNRAHCIGHGLCERACPVDAITLVFGTEKRGVELPRIRETFETNVEGIYIVGELGGMGLIRNAFEQGRQCIEYIRKAGGAGQSASGGSHPGTSGSHPEPNGGGSHENVTTPSPAGQNGTMYDLVIVGCGPAGLSASIHAKEAGLSFVTLDREDIGGTVRYYPRKKLVMTRPIKIPKIGKIHYNEISKESLIELWEKLVDVHDLKPHLHLQVAVDTIRKTDDAYEVTTTGGSFRARRVILAIGRRGTPRKLGIPGEDRSNVAYSLLEPDRYVNERITVVGGGDSAIEAALALSDQPGNRVRLSYRKDRFTRLKPANYMKLQDATDAGTVELALNTQVVRNAVDSIDLQHADGRIETLDNDSLFIFAGGILPTDFLKRIGIQIDVKFGQPR